MRDFVHIEEAGFETPAQFHDYIAQKLAFPAHYGRNLDALADCLGDVSVPTTLVIKRVLPDIDEDGWPQADERAMASWFERACAVMTRAVAANPRLEAIVEYLHDDTPPVR